MEIVPVIDLKQGLVVRGIAGRREAYRPIVSRLTPDPGPASIANALRQAYGFSLAYVADLDAIGGAEPDIAAYRAIAGAGMQLWIDAGVGDVATARQLLAHAEIAGSIDALIIGLESLRARSQLALLVEEIGPSRLVFSLDLRDGKPITHIAKWEAADPLAIATEVAETGLERLIVLDLAAVGTGRGPATLALGTQLAERLPHLERISGGGVRSRDDLEKLAAAGYHRALVASALHDGGL